MNIIGKGGFAREVECYVKHKGLTPHLYENEEVETLSLFAHTIIAIGDVKVRKKIAEQYSYNYITFGLADIWGTYSTGEGCILCPGTTVTTNVTLGKHVIVNINCTIGHDVVIGDYVTISPGANISGNVTIGNLCYIGTNAVIREKISICDEVTIGAGAVVVKNITEPGVYVGSPAKKIN